ncbi:MAG: class I SAM-dependent methyltransferase [Gammaproteobacteria bacterium]|nr:class I SAM-dependent methyltransferase [Gammaproteobacteria bacterium]
MTGEASFPCRLCGSHNLQFYFALGNDGRFRYYRCPDCALVNYDLAQGLDQEQYSLEFIDPTDDQARRNLDKDQSWAFIQRQLPGPGRLLDIGCGTGRLLYLAQRAGWQAKGLELSAPMAAFVRDKLGVEVVVGDFLATEPAPGDAAAYDVVCLRHVLEHLPDGLGAMARIRALLRPGGYFLAEMPNVEAWSKRWRRLAERAGLHRRRFPENFVAGHCNEYSRRSFQELCRRSGFELLRWETYSKKPLANWLLNRVAIGTKARALARLA